jgi:hypothetical protein
MKYPKIQSLWKRDMKNDGAIIEGAYSRSEFRNIKEWAVTEKLDGTNIRLEYSNEDFCYGYSLKFKGRTDKAQIPSGLKEHLERTFPLEKVRKMFMGAHLITLFGEGIGPKIQKGGELYCDSYNFVCFDAYIDGWWLRYESLAELLAPFCIPVVPRIGIMKLPEIIEYVKSFPYSIQSQYPKRMEGIVARSHPLVLYRNSSPVIFKLKAHDYQS